MAIPILNLVNFETDIAEGCVYVLTSPRSLQACSKVKIKPVQLLKVTLGDILNANQDLSVSEARAVLIKENIYRTDLLEKCKVARDNIITGKDQEMEKVENEVKKTESYSKIHSQQVPLPSPYRSISSPVINEMTGKTKMKGLKSSSLPTSLYSTPRSNISHMRDDRLLNLLLRKYSDRKRELKEARQQWLKWETEKIQVQKRKIERQKNIQALTTKHRADISLLTEMVAQKEDEINREREEKEARIREKMRKVEIKAREKRAEREARIRENAREEERKLEKQRFRLEEQQKQKEIKEKELVIGFDKKLSEAEKHRNIHKLRGVEVIQRRNDKSRRHFETNFNEVLSRKEQETRRKEIELNARLTQARDKSRFLMEQRSQAIRAAANRRRCQISGVQIAKDSILKQQHERNERDMKTNAKNEETALCELEKLRKQQIEQTKEKHEYERKRALENLQKSKIEFEQGKAFLEMSINKKAARSEQLRKDKERINFLSKTRAKQEGTRRELIKKDLETFDERARKAEIFANMISPLQTL